MIFPRFTAIQRVVDKDGRATKDLSTPWDNLCRAVERIVGTAPTAFDPGTITLPELAARVKALEDRIAGSS
jgi:hypothetical protein